MGLWVLSSAAMPANTATSLSSWARAIRKPLEASGCDGDALLREAGMDPALLDDPTARYPLAQTTRLWRLAVAASGDPCFGLRVASAVSQTTFHALGYTLMASTTLREAFERVVRYFRIVTDAGELALVSAGDEVHLELRPLPGPEPADEAVDAFVSVFVRMCRALAGRDYAPLRIELRRAAPADRSGFDRVLRAPLVFGAPVTRLVFDAAGFERPLEGANPELALHNDAIVVRHLARFDKQNIRARVEAALIERLPHGEPSQDEIAAALHVSTRSLQRRLAEAGTSYRDLLDDTRRALAVSYLRDKSYSVSEVTYLLGFSDTSSFSRAFRRWTGESPSEFRPTPCAASWRAAAGCGRRGRPARRPAPARGRSRRGCRADR
jgi:AraC-like DNA-binding protein